jgi:chemotaxis protein CheY-P-specific phosphatase CheC
MDSAYLDTLRELCSFGGGHAATGLSKLFNRKVKIAMPLVKVAHAPNEQRELLPDAKGNILIASLIKFESGEDALLVQAYPSAEVHTLVELVSDNKEENLSKEIEDSFLMEVANLISGALVSALSNFIGEVIEPFPPFFLAGKEEKVLNNLQKRQKKNSHGAFLVQIKISIEHTNLNFDLSFIPFFDLVEKVWKIAKG